MEERKQAIKKYNKLKKKYDLPGLDDLESTINICLEKPYFHLNDILSSVAKRIFSPINHIMDLMQPKSILDIMEANFIDESEKDRLIKFGENTMKVVREINAAIYSEEKEKIKMIKKGFDYYKKEVMPFSKEFTSKLAEKWGQEETKEDIQNYFG